MKLLFTSILFLFLVTGVQNSIFAQQNRHQWRAGVGVGNQFVNGEISGRSGAQKDGLASFDSDFLLYAASFEYLPSLAWGIKLQGVSSPSLERFGNADLLFTYYSDNRNLFDRESFIAPYIGFGLGNDFLEQELYLPVGLGLKFRLGDRINLNLEYFTRTKLEQISNEFSFSEDVSGFSQLSLNINFGRRAKSFEGPVIYTSDAYNYVEDVLMPLSSDSLSNPLGITYPSEKNQEQTEVNLAVIPLKKTEKKEAKESDKTKPYTFTIINNNVLTVMQSPEGYQVISDSSRLKVDSSKSTSYIKSDTLVISSEGFVLKEGSATDSEDSVGVVKDDSIKSVNDSVLQTNIVKTTTDSVQAQNQPLAPVLTGRDKNSKLDSVNGTQQQKGFSLYSQPKSDSLDADSLENPLLGKKIPRDSSTNDIKTNKADTTGIKPASSNIKNQSGETSGDSLIMNKEGKARINGEDSAKVSGQKAVDNDSTARKSSNGQVLLGTSATSSFESDENRKKVSENEQIEELKKEIELLKAQQLAIEENQKTGSTTKKVKMREKNISEYYYASDASDTNEEKKSAEEKTSKEEKVELSTPPPSQKLVLATGNQSQKDSISMENDSVLTDDVIAMQKQIDSLTVALQKDSASAKLAEIDSIKNRLEIDALKRKLSEMERERKLENQREDSLKSAETNYNEALKEVQNTNVFFKISDSGLTEEALNKLSKIVSFMNNYPRAVASLKGYTDPTGNAVSNMTLSRKRAQAVLDYLQGNGISSSRANITYIGIDNTADKDSRDYSYNRRVNIFF